MSPATIKRVRQGVPAGGQFATQGRTEIDLELTGDDASSPADPAEHGSIVERESLYTQRYETIDDKLAALHGEIEGHDAALADDDYWHSYLDAMSKFHRYSFGNQLLIAMQTRGQASHVMGFRKWTELDRSVMKGEKASPSWRRR